MSLGVFANRRIFSGVELAWSCAISSQMVLSAATMRPSNVCHSSIVSQNSSSSRSFGRLSLTAPQIFRMSYTRFVPYHFGSVWARRCCLHSFVSTCGSDSSLLLAVLVVATLVVLVVATLVVLVVATLVVLVVATLVVWLQRSVGSVVDWPSSSLGAIRAGGCVEAVCESCDVRARFREWNDSLDRVRVWRFVTFCFRAHPGDPFPNPFLFVPAVTTVVCFSRGCFFAALSSGSFGAFCAKFLSICLCPKIRTRQLEFCGGETIEFPWTNFLVPFFEAKSDT
jgi:hypothetical protein